MIIREVLRIMNKDDIKMEMIANGYYSEMKYNQWCLKKFGRILVEVND